MGNKSEPDILNTLEMEIALMRYFEFNKNYVVPNVTKMSNLVRFETDIISVTKSGYATGVEIKVSKSDMKADFRKHHHMQIKRLPKTFDLFYKPFKYFYYAFPHYLYDDLKELVPKRFGILTVHGLNHVRMRREAKFLFNTKWTNKMILNLLRLGTMRIYGLKTNALNLSKGD